MSFAEDLECWIEMSHYELMMRSKVEQAVINRSIIAEMKEEGVSDCKILESLSQRFEDILDEASHLMDESRMTPTCNKFEFKSVPMS